MASKDVLKHGENYVPTINDSESSQFGAYETYSRDKIDTLVKSPGVTAFGYDWSGRKISCEGDSHVANVNTGFPAYLAETLGAQTINIAVPGVPIMGDYPGKAHDFRRRLAKIPADVDLIYIQGDSNAISTNVNDLNSTDISTWGGRWNVAINAIKKSFPTVPLFLVADYPHRGVDMDRTWHYAVQFERTAVRYGATYICLGKDIGFAMNYAAKVWGLTETDNGHCNNESMKIWGDYIARRILETKPPKWLGYDTIAIDATATVAVGATTDIGYTITGDQSIQWTSDNMDVACVMGGTVYGMAAGTATITAKTRSGKTATCTVTVAA